MTAARIPRSVKREPIASGTDVFTIADFVQACRDGNFIDDDGHGYFATATEETNRSTSPSDVLDLVDRSALPSWATHITWYNK